MLNLDNPSCQLINASVSARSLWAEKLSVTHKPSRCSVHTLFHNWEAMTNEERRDYASRSNSVRFDGYVEVSPGRWILRDVKPAKKKSDD